MEEREGSPRFKKKSEIGQEGEEGEEERLYDRGEELLRAEGERRGTKGGASGYNRRREGERGGERERQRERERKKKAPT